MFIYESQSNVFKHCWLSKLNRFINYLIQDVNCNIQFIRYVFTIEDVDTVAPCYEYFLTGLNWLKYQKTDSIDWTIEEVKSDFPQYFTYEKTRHMVLWKIHADLKTWQLYIRIYLTYGPNMIASSYYLQK